MRAERLRLFEQTPPIMAPQPAAGRGADLRITLEQWQALQAVVDHGSYARAAGALHKSQSAVTYAVQKVQSLLGVNAFEIRGRKAVLTEAGQVLYRRARTLVEEAVALERGTGAMTADWKPGTGLAG